MLGRFVCASEHIHKMHKMTAGKTLALELIAHVTIRALKAFFAVFVFLPDKAYFFFLKVVKVA